MSDARDLRLLQHAAFTSSFDRLMIAPLLIVIAQDLRLPLATVTAAATVNLVAYGLMQMVWALVSDRFGRVRTMRVALALAGAAGVAAAFSTSFGWLLVARALAGASFAAAVPGALIYIGDTVPLAQRQGPLSDLMRGTAVGSAAATVGAGAVAELVSWRAAFAVVGVTSLLLAVRLGKLAEPEVHGRLRVGASLRAVLQSRWALLVLLLAAGEGFILLSVLTFLPAAVAASDGVNAAVAGGVVAVYGVAVLGATPVVKRRAPTVAPSRLVLSGGLLSVVGLGLFTVHRGMIAVGLGCLFLGTGWAFMHSTLQTWVTEVVPSARAMAVSMFATVLFTGSAAGTFVAAAVLGASTYASMFGTMTLLGLALALGGWRARSRYSG